MSNERVLSSLGDFCAVPGMPSEPTLRKIIRENPDFPVVRIGTSGSAYEIDVEAGVAWLKSHEEQRRAAEREQRDKVQQYALELLGDDAAVSHDQVGMSASERKALLEEELVAIKVSERRGQLIRKDSVEEAASAVLVLDARLRSSFSARLTKRIDLPREAIAAIDALMEQDRRNFAAEMRKLAETSDVDAEAGADPAL